LPADGDFFVKKFFIFVALIFFVAGNFFPDEPIHHNPWELIIYRPENSSAINDVRAFLKIEDENGNDATSSVSATYEWISSRGIVNRYEKSFYLSGGMAMHLLLAKGKYFFSFFSPESETQFSSAENKNRWESNRFFYDTENPAKVIFLFPAADENGFYKGEWILDYRAPEFYKFTKPRISR
jgi:hypothetical protein